MPNRSNLKAQLASQGIDLDNLSLHTLETLFAPKSFEEIEKIMLGQPTTPGFRPAPKATETPVAVTGGTTNVTPMPAMPDNFEGNRTVPVQTSTPAPGPQPSVTVPQQTQVVIPGMPAPPPSVTSGEETNNG